MCDLGLLSLKADTAHSVLALLSLVCHEETVRQWSYHEFCHWSHEAHSELSWEGERKLNRCFI